MLTSLILVSVNCYKYFGSIATVHTYDLMEKKEKPYSVNFKLGSVIFFIIFFITTIFIHSINHSLIKNCTKFVSRALLIDQSKQCVCLFCKIAVLAD